MKRKENKERMMRILIARIQSELMRGRLILACPLLLPNHAAASATCHIPMKEGVFFPERLALPLETALFSLPLLATSLPVLAAPAE